MLAEQGQVLGDLHRQLARRRQDDRLGVALAGVDALDQGDAEGGGLAGAGEGLGDDVFALEQRRDGLGLHGRGLLEAHVFQTAAHGLTEIQSVKIGQRWFFFRDVVRR